MWMIAEPGYQTLRLNVYSLSSTSSIRIQGFPLADFRFNNFTILASDIRINGIHNIIAGFSMAEIKATVFTREIFK